jgi:phage recombination protein Bet
MSKQANGVKDMALVPAEQATTTALPEAVAKRGVNEAQWRTLCSSLYPGADPKSVLMVLDYCKARQLDPLKKPCHIVPMQVKDARTNTYGWRDVVMPGIYEYRTTAQRTGDYLGHSKPAYGETQDFRGTAAPEWCELTAFRHHPAGKVEFPVRVYFREVVGTNNEGKPNARWAKAPIQMLTKCAEAAALREAFPDEFGGEVTAEEMDGQRHVEVVAENARPLPPKPEDYDSRVIDLEAAADEGETKLDEAWAAAKPEVRDYVAAAQPDLLDSLKQRAAAKA